MVKSDKVADVQDACLLFFKKQKNVQEAGNDSKQNVSSWLMGSE